MNHFEYFDLEPGFQVDVDLLRQRYLKKSRELHPDLNRELDEDTLNALSAENNTAYTTLKDEMYRIKYLVNLYGELMEQSGPDQLFLMDMMELNEAIDEALQENDLKKNNDITLRLESFKSDVLSTWNEVDKSKINASSIAAANDFLTRMKYIDRMEKLLSGNQEL